MVARRQPADGVSVLYVPECTVFRTIIGAVINVLIVRKYSSKHSLFTPSTAPIIMAKKKEKKEKKRK
jgi:hypothetical protein